jgi:hypothetical protein
MIFPSSIVLNKLEGCFFLWIKGENRSGKTALAVDIAEYYLRDNFRLLSNLDTPWNDVLPLELDSNGQLNAVVILDEGGVYMRTKESIRRVMGFKGKLNALFLMPSSEEPHEDLWRNYIEPAELLNEKIIKFLFGQWFLDHILKIWRLVRFDAKKGTRETIFLQIFPSSVWHLYSTLISGRDASLILAQFDQSLADQQAFFGNTSALKLSDLATGKTGLAEGQSFLGQQMASYTPSSKRKLLSPKA